MAGKLTDRILGTAPWLDVAGARVQQVLAPLQGPQGPRGIQDFLNGTWLGHPLHTSLVSVPIGAWTTTLVLDAAGMEQGADLSVLLGLLGALGAAATGAAQWEDTGGKARGLGFLHASLNVSAMALYSASLLLRARGARKSGVALSTLGYTLVGASGWLGGELSYDLGVGVNRTAFEEPEPVWTRAIAFKFALAPQFSVLNRNDAAHPAEHLAIGPYEPATVILRVTVTQFIRYFCHTNSLAWASQCHSYAII